MSYSKEYQYYHLTAKGWVEGTFNGTPLGSKNEKEIPSDRVLTIRCIDETVRVSGTNFDSVFSDSIVWEISDKEKINELKNKYGEKPDWFGYKR